MSYRSTKGKVIIQGSNFTETLLLSLINQMVQATQEEMQYKYEIINKVLQANLYGELSLDKSQEKTFMKCISRIWRDMFPEVLFPEKELKIYDLRTTLFEYLWRQENREKIVPAELLLRGEHAKAYLKQKIEDLIFFSVIMFFKITGVVK